MSDLIQRLTQTNQFHENADVSPKEVVDALEKQQAEIDLLTKVTLEKRITNKAYSIMEAELAALKAQAAKDAADAWRYRWLREYKLSHNGHCQSMIGPILWSKSLDEAVDVAMKESQQ